MIGCLRTRIRKQPIIALYFESETVLKCYNIEARAVPGHSICIVSLTHLRLASLLWDISKQSRTRSDAAKRGAGSGSALFAYRWNTMD